MYLHICYVFIHKLINAKHGNWLMFHDGDQMIGLSYILLYIERMCIFLQLKDYVWRIVAENGEQSEIKNNCKISMFPVYNSFARNIQIQV